MKDSYLTVLVVGLGLAVMILYMVRRDHIYIRQGMFWILVAAISTAFGLYPPLVDVVGGAFGVAYPPTLLLLVAIIVLLLKALLGDIALTKVRRDLRRLNQRIALLETSELLPRAGEPGEK
jgi:hypothetical protein